MSSIIDVAAISGVSTATVSRMINKTGPVSREARERIKAAIVQLQYTPNAMAQGLKTNFSKSIGILIPDFANPYYAEIFKGIETVLRKNKHMGFVCNTSGHAVKELNYIKELQKRKIDGIIYFTYRRNNKCIDYLKSLSKDIPVVFMDPVFDPAQDISFVISNGFKGSCDATAYLISKKCKRIAYVKGPEDHMVTKERFKGYMEALKINGLQYNKEFIYEGDFSMQSGIDAAKALMALKTKPDAIMAATDVMAVGVLKYLEFAKVRVPQDVKVMGFDNILLSSVIEPGLSTVAQPIISLGEEAAKYVLDKKNRSQKNILKKTLECRLIIRRSTDSSIPKTLF